MALIPGKIGKLADLQKDLKQILNKYSEENASNTPDFLLAEYLMRCLDTWNIVVTKREKWYGREVK